MRLLLAPVARSLFEKRRGKRRSTPSRADLAELDEALARAKVPDRSPMIQFERDYGGLVLPEHLVGPLACLRSGMKVETAKKRKLVPVIATDNDNVYFLAADGTVWAEDQIEDPVPVRFARDGRALLSRMLFREHVFDCPDDRRITTEGRTGEELAKQHGLDALADASDEDERWWSDGKKFLVERAKTTTLAWVRAPKAPPKPRAVTWEEVANEYPSVSAVRRVSGKHEAIRAAFLAAIGKMKMKVREMDDANSRVGLELDGHRVEVFFRDNGIGTTVNVYQYDVKPARCDAAATFWHDQILARLE